MKKLLLLTIGLLTFFFSWAQAPQGFTYQAVVRNASGELMSNQSVKFKLSLTSEDGLTVHYTETHLATTSPQGIANLVVGEGSAIMGVFADIPWETSTINLKVEVDPAGGNAFTEMGIVPLKSVPYALYAPQSGEVVSTPEALDEDPIFVVRNKLGQIVFAVYQSGVRMYVDESTTKSSRGGFAIGGIGDNLKEGNKYFMVTPDSVRVNLREPIGKNTRGGFAIGGIGDNLKGQPSNLFYIGQDSARIYIDTTSAGKSTRGGFAIGGIGDNLKGKGIELMRVTKDSTRVYVKSSPSKGSRGGFAIGGIGDNLKETAASNFLFLTPENYFIGHDAGSNTTPIGNEIGKFNTFIGYQSGMDNTQGRKNIFLGYQSGMGNTWGDENIFIGYLSGTSNINGANNIFIGNESGYNNGSGNRNLFIGNEAGFSNVDGWVNTFIGMGSGYSNVEGNSNLFVGLNSGYTNFSGSNNTFLGTSSGYANYNGENNTFVGNGAGTSNTSGSRNTFMGENAGNGNTDGYDNVIIGRGSGSSASSGTYNTLIGSQSGSNLTAGTSNVFIGSSSGSSGSSNFNVYIGQQTGQSATNQSGNVLIGHQAGLAVTGGNNVMIGYHAGNQATGSDNVYIGYRSGFAATGNKKLYIAHNAQTPIIYGDFQLNRVGINTINPQQAFEVNGGTRITGNLILSSTETTTDSKLDVQGPLIRFRDISYLYGEIPLFLTSEGYLSAGTSKGIDRSNITSISNALASINTLQGIKFELKTPNGVTKKIGLIPEEVAKVFPELIYTNPADGNIGINYAEITAVLVEAIKEQQLQIQKLEKHNSLLELKVNEIETLKAELEAIKAMLAK